MRALRATCDHNDGRQRSREIQFGHRINLPGFVMSFSRNEEIFGEGETADFVYKVISGAIRTIRVLSDGRRQVGAFHLSGEVFGLEVGALHRFSAEAVGDCQIAVIRRSHVDRAAGLEAGTACELWTMAAQELARLQDHLLLLSRKSAVERVGAFLIEMAERSGGIDRLDLPMSRTDIADYLGLTIETVSRTFTQLERDGAISLPSCRRVIINDRGALTPSDG